MVERVKNLGFRNEVIGGRRTSGFSPPPAGGSPIQGFLQGFEAIVRNEKAEAIQAERNKEKALKAYLDTISVDYKTQLDVMAHESPRNPRAFVKKATGYRDGIVKNAPPSLQGLIGARIDNYLNLKRAKANEAATVEIQAQNQATEDRLASKDFGIVSEASDGLYRRDLDVRNASEVEIESLERELATRLFAQGMDDFGVVTDAFKKEDITKRLQNFRDISQSAAIKGWFREQDNPDKAYLQLKRGGFKIDVTTFRRNRKDNSVEEDFKQVDVMNAISETARKKVLEDMGSEIKSINIIEGKEEKQEIKDTKKIQRLNGFDNWRKLEEPDPADPPLTAETVRQQLEANLITKDDAVAQLKVMTEPDAVVDDPDYVDVVERQTDSGIEFLEEINEGFTAGLLTAETAGKLRSENRNMLNKELTSIEKSVIDVGKTGLADLKRGLNVNSVFTINDKFQGERQVKALQEMRRRIKEVENEAEINTQEDIDLYEEKINRLTNELIKTHRFKNRNKAPIPPEVPALTPDQVTMKSLTEGVKKLRNQKDMGTITEGAFNTGSHQIMQLIENLKAKESEAK